MKKVDAMPRQVVDNADKRLALNVRTTEALRSQLEEAAMRSGRVLSQEVGERLKASFDSEHQNALQEEIKNEMRGTIAALEQRIDLMEKGERLLWPNASTRALGDAFAMTIGAVQHLTGQSWRESPTAAIIVAGVVRRTMEECGRGGSLFAELFEHDRIAAMTDIISRSAIDDVRAKLPPLPNREPQDDPANWTGRARVAVVFRDKASGEALETFRSEEYDTTAPGPRPHLGADYRAALARFEPIRDTVEAEDYVVHRLRDGSTVWDSLSKPGNRIVMRPATHDELAGMVPVDDPKRPAAIFDGHDHADLGLEYVGGPDDDDESPPAPKPTPAPSRRRKVKAGA